MLMAVQRYWHKIQFSRKAQQAFLEDLAALIQDGVPVNQAVETIQQVSAEATEHVAKELTDALATGRSLADGMQVWFPTLVVEIIRAGESGGHLAEALQAAAETFAQQRQALKQLIQHLTYPLIVVCLALAISVFIKESVFASFIRIKPLFQWPNLGQTLYGLGDFVEVWWWLVLIVAIVFVVLIARLLRHMTGPLRVWLDQLPVINLYKHMIAARFMECLGLLIKNGVMLNQALMILHQGAQPYLAWHLFQMQNKLTYGYDNLADVLDTHLISKADLIRLKVMARSRQFDQALIRLGRQASERSVNQLIRTSKIAGALCLILGAMLAAMMVFGIYLVGSTLTH